MTRSPVDAMPDTLQISLSGREVAGCLPCADRLCLLLRGQEGVTQAQVNTATATLTVAFDPTRTDPERLTTTAKRAQSDLATQFLHKTYGVAGMDCPNCASGLEQVIAKLPGVASVSVQFSAARMRVELDPADTQAQAHLLTRAGEMGYTLTDRAVSQTTSLPSVRPSLLAFALSTTGQAITSAILLGIGLLAEHLFHAPAFATNAIYTASIVAGGYRFGVAALSSLKNRIVSTNLLMSLAAIGAACIGHFEEAAMVIALYAVGLALEGAAMARTRKSLSDLIEAAPLEAVHLLPGGETIVVPAGTLTPGDRVVVRPGAKVPADGIIVSGRSSLVEAAITGESLPKSKGEGDMVFAGTLNGEGAIVVNVTAVAQDSTLARILHLVEEAQGQKAPAQAMVERFGQIYTPFVLVIALLVATVGPLFTPQENWLYRALSLLVVACPCALVIATPVAYVAAIARAARDGVLVKGGIALEALAGATHFFMDKTGTLTQGDLTITEIACAENITERDLLSVACAAESMSEHPVARAVVRAGKARGISPSVAEGVMAIPGQGIRATVAGQEVLVGNAALLVANQIAVPAQLMARAEAFQNLGGTVLFVAVAGEVWGALSAADTVRSEAKAMVAGLKSAGMRVTVLTGDNENAAQHIAALAGIDDVRAGLLPQDKQQIVKLAGKSTVFVGDGINDAPALASSGVGVAMGAGGTAVALETADIALMRPDLSLLVSTLKLAKATRDTVRINIAIAIGAVAFLLIGTLAGKVPLPVGVLGHEGSALLVILNGIALLRPRKK